MAQTNTHTYPAMVKSASEFGDWFNIRLPDEIDRWLNHYAKANNISRNQAVALAVQRAKAEADQEAIPA